MIYPLHSDVDKGCSGSAPQVCLEYPAMIAVYRYRGSSARQTSGASKECVQSIRMLPVGSLPIARVWFELLGMIWIRFPLFPTSRYYKLPTAALHWQCWLSLKTLMLNKMRFAKDFHLKSWKYDTFCRASATSIRKSSRWRRINLSVSLGLNKAGLWEM